MIKTILTAALVVVSVLLGATILLQARGSGLGATFGGEGNIYRTVRGVEKILFRLSIVLAAAFLAIALALSLFAS